MAKAPKTTKESDAGQSEKPAPPSVIEEETPQPEEKPVPEDVPVTDIPQARPKPRRRSGGFIALLLGGAAAAAIGFAMARYVVPQGWPFPGVTPEPDPVALAQEAQAEEIAALTDSLKAQGEAIATLKADTSVETLRGEMRGEFGALQAKLQALGERLDAVEARLVAVEKLPSGSGTEAAEAAAAAYERELAQMRAMLDAELARLDEAQDDAKALETSAAEAARAATGRAALSRVFAALESGQPFGDALFDLEQATGVNAPEPLAALASDGVATLSALQESFPPAAREALDAAIRAAVAAGEIDRVSAFFRTQLGTRSLSPREGDDPDAVLSRAEDALRQGRLSETLEDLATLPDAAQPAMKGWIARAVSRRDALEAAQDLADRLNSE